MLDNKYMKLVDNSKLGFAIAGTSKGAQTFLCCNINLSLIELDPLLKDIRSEISIDKLNYSLFCIANETHVQLCNYFIIQDVEGRIGYVGLYLIIPENKKLNTSNLLSLFNELKEVFTTDYMQSLEVRGRTFYCINERKLREAESVFEQVLTNFESKYKLVPAVHESTNSDTKTAFIKYEDDEALEQMLDDYDNDALQKYKRIYFLPDKDRATHSYDINFITLPPRVKKTSYKIKTIGQKSVPVYDVSITITNQNNIKKELLCDGETDLFIYPQTDELTITAYKNGYEENVLDDKKVKKNSERLNENGYTEITIELTKIEPPKPKPSSSYYDIPVQLEDDSITLHEQSNTKVVEKSTKSEKSKIIIFISSLILFLCSGAYFLFSTSDSITPLPPEPSTTIPKKDTNVNTTPTKKLEYEDSIKKEIKNGLDTIEDAEVKATLLKGYKEMYKDNRAIAMYCDTVKKSLKQKINDDRGADNKKAADKVASDKVASDKVASDNAAADKKIADKKIADKKIADKKIADKKIADKKIADNKAADKVASDKVAADKKIADKKIADKKISDKKISDKKIADKKIADKKIADKKIADKRDN
jgi:hypothetical protein